MLDWKRFNRRDFLRFGAASAAVAGAACTLGVLLPEAGRAGVDAPHPQSPHPRSQSDVEHNGHSLSMTVGDVGPDAIGIDPMAFLTTFDYGTVSTLPSG